MCMHLQHQLLEAINALRGEILAVRLVGVLYSQLDIRRPEVLRELRRSPLAIEPLLRQAATPTPIIDVQNTVHEPGRVVIKRRGAYDPITDNRETRRRCKSFGRGLGHGSNPPPNSTIYDHGPPLMRLRTAIPTMAALTTKPVHAAIAYEAQKEQELHRRAS